jgi:hypothetical protein
MFIDSPLRLSLIELSDPTWAFPAGCLVRVQVKFELSWECFHDTQLRCV